MSLPPYSSDFFPRPRTPFRGGPHRAPLRGGPHRAPLRGGPLFGSFRGRPTLRPPYPRPFEPDPFEPLPFSRHFGPPLRSYPSIDRSTEGVIRNGLCGSGVSEAPTESKSLSLTDSQNSKFEEELTEKWTGNEKTKKRRLQRMKQLMKAKKESGQIPQEMSFEEYLATFPSPTNAASCKRQIDELFGEKSADKNIVPPPAKKPSLMKTTENADKRDGGESGDTSAEGQSKNLCGNEKTKKRRLQRLKQLLKAKQERGILPESLSFEEFYNTEGYCMNSLNVQKELDEVRKEKVIINMSRKTSTSDEFELPVTALHCSLCGYSNFNKLQEYKRHLYSSDHMMLRSVLATREETEMIYFKARADFAEVQKSKKLENVDRIIFGLVRRRSTPSVGLSQKFLVKKELQEQNKTREFLLGKSSELLAYEKSRGPKLCELCNLYFNNIMGYEDHLCSLQHLKASYLKKHPHGGVDNVNEEVVAKRESESSPKEDPDFVRGLIEMIDHAKQIAADEPVTLENLPIYDQNEPAGLESLELQATFFCNTCDISMQSKDVEEHVKGLGHYKGLIADLKVKCEDKKNLRKEKEEEAERQQQMLNMIDDGENGETLEEGNDEGCGGMEKKSPSRFVRTFVDSLIKKTG